MSDTQKWDIHTPHQRAETMLQNFSPASILSRTIFPVCPVLGKELSKMKTMILDYKKLIKCIVGGDAN